MNFAFLAIFTLFSTVSFLAILFGADPYSSGDSVVALFFMEMFLALAGIFSLAGVLVARMMKGSLEYLAPLRRGFLLAALATSLVLVEKFFSLNIGNAAAIFIVIVAIEMIVAYRSSVSVSSI